MWCQSVRVPHDGGHLVATIQCLLQNCRPDKTCCASQCDLHGVAPLRSNGVIGWTCHENRDHDPACTPYPIRNLRKYARLPAQSERRVRAIAERWGLGLLALAQGDFFLFLQCKLDRLEPGSLMRPVTERLVP